MQGSENMSSPRKYQHSGFTIVEMAMVLILFGLVISIAMTALRYYTGQFSEKNTIAALDKNNSAIVAFQATQQRYPCPADPKAGPGNPRYGVEDCTNVSGNIITVLGRDADNADGDNNIATGGDPVMVGAIPFRTFIDPNNDGNLSDGVFDEYIASYGLDGWGRKYTYAVTASLADPTKNFNESAGTLYIEDEQHNNLLESPGTGHYIIISHGEDGVGAYGSGTGNPAINCTNGVVAPPPPPGTPPVVTAADETENCDFNLDATFLNGVKSNSTSQPYDDYIRYSTGSTTSLWTYTGATFVGTSIVYQVSAQNGGNVGIATKTPAEKLDVNGNIQAEQVHAEEICPENGNSALCMPIETIAGDVGDMKCTGQGQIVVSISNNKVTCANAFTSVPASTCAAGSFMTGISSKTGVICKVF
jgi:prepilin-type N-terminal cleavage/methylation domain-containing protein